VELDDRLGFYIVVLALALFFSKFNVYCLINMVEMIISIVVFDNINVSR